MHSTLNFSCFFLRAEGLGTRLIIIPLFVRHTVPKVPGSIPWTDTHIFHFFFLFFFFFILFICLFLFLSSSSSFSSMGNYQSPLKRVFEGGDAADSTVFCVVNCIANRSAKSCFWRESEKINNPQKFLRVLAS